MECRFYLYVCQVKNGKRVKEVTLCSFEARHGVAITDPESRFHRFARGNPNRRLSFRLCVVTPLRKRQKAATLLVFPTWIKSIARSRPQAAGVLASPPHGSFA